jgi:hypothetical protein
MNTITITQAAAICGYDRSYFYKVIQRLNISVKKTNTGKSYLDPAELFRVIPADNLNMTLLEQYTGQKITTPQHNEKTQETTQDNELIKQLKSEIDFLKNQLCISQEQNALLLDTVNKQMLLLENKPQHHTNTDNTETQKTTPPQQPKKSIMDSDMKAMINRLKSKSK